MFCTAHPLLRITLRHLRWRRFFPLARKEQKRAAFEELKLSFALTNNAADRLTASWFAIEKQENETNVRDPEVCSGFSLRGRRVVELLLVFSVTPFKIDFKKNQNHSTYKVQNLGNERRYIYKDPCQDLGRRNNLYTRYPKKCFTQIYRALYGDAMLELIRMSSNMADGNQQKHLLSSFATKA